MECIFRIPLHKQDSIRAHLVKTGSWEAYRELLNFQVQRKKIQQKIGYDSDSASESNTIGEADELLKNYMDVNDTNTIFSSNLYIQFNLIQLFSNIFHFFLKLYNSEFVDYVSSFLSRAS